MDGLISGVVLVITLFVAFLIEKKPWGWKGYEIIASWRERGLQGISAFWAQVPFLKIIYIFVAGIIGLYLIELFFNLLDSVAGISTDEDITPSQVRNLAIAFLGTITGLGALFGVYLAIRRTEESKRQSDASERDATTAEQGLITDRINKATEGLDKINKSGDAEIPVRVGALYSLGRIAQDSLRDHIQIMEMLCIYIRHNNPCKSRSTKEKNLREDIQAALTVVGRRIEWAGGEERLKAEKEKRYRLDLYNCDLRTAILSRANLRGARFLDSNLSYASFDNADLSNAWFENTVMNHTWFGRAKMDRAWACECDFSKCRDLTQEQLDAMYCGKDVKIPDGLTRPNHWPTDELPFFEFQEAYWEWEMAQPDSYLKPQDTKAPAT